MHKEHLILHIDDDDDDKQLLRRAFDNLQIPFRIIESCNGQEGIELLEEWQKDQKLPCLIVLDINMPKMDGKQTYTTIRSNTQLSAIPIVVFSTSTSPMDKLFFKAKDVEYMVKPIVFDDLVDIALRMLRLCNQADIYPK